MTLWPQLLLALALAPATWAQGPLDPALLGKPPVEAWPTYHGDYSGRHYSTLNQINQSNVKALSLAWVYRINTLQSGAIVGGEGADDPPAAGSPIIKAVPLMVNGVLYFSVPDHAWAVDARTGQEIWHYFWKTKGGIHIGNRGMGMYGNWLFLETPDCYLVSLDAATGMERWHKQIADVKQEYFCTPAPLIVDNRVIAGVGGDSLDVPGWLESRDPETGDVQWKWYTTPRPGPVMAGQSRKGDNLWTASIVALNPDTGNVVWYFQASPHDTHDWDNTEVPVLIDGEIGGQPRKLLAQAARNGFYFLLDRTNGKNLTSTPFVESLNWHKGVDAQGRPIPNPDKEPKLEGVLVSPGSTGVTNWPAPSFNPETGLLYVGTQQTFSMFYLTDTDPHPQGYGASERQAANLGSFLRAIDYKTGNVVWKHPTQVGAQGLLSTAGGLLFGGDGAGNFIAFDPKTGDPLWHAGVGNTSNAPITYLLDGHQYVVVGAGDSLYAFYLQ